VAGSACEKKKIAPQNKFTYGPSAFVVTMHDGGPGSASYSRRRSPHNLLHDVPGTVPDVHPVDSDSRHHIQGNDHFAKMNSVFENNKIAADFAWLKMRRRTLSRLRAMHAVEHQCHHWFKRQTIKCKSSDNASSKCLWHQQGSGLNHPVHK